MTYLPFAPLLFIGFSQDYTLAVKINADISWCRLLHNLTAFGRQDACAGLILSVPGFFHRLLTALETKCPFKANLFDKLSVTFLFFSGANSDISRLRNFPEIDRICILHLNLFVSLGIILAGSRMACDNFFAEGVAL